MIEFWNLVETYNPDGTESWLHEEINNAELFRGDCITAHEGEGYLSALKTRLIAGNYGLTMSLRC